MKIGPLEPVRAPRRPRNWPTARPRRLARSLRIPFTARQGRTIKCEGGEGAMDIRITAYGAAMLALCANAAAAPMGAFSKPVMARTPFQLAGDCIRYSDCQYRWLRCGNGWCRGPLDPFGDGSAPKVEMHCTTTVEPCGPEQQKGTAGGCFGGGPCGQASGTAE